MSEFWCFNCQQCVEEEEVYNSPRHRTFLDKRMAAVHLERAPHQNRKKSVCICQDCVFYRIQVCSCCNKGAPLCMFTLEEWFVSNSLHRKCLDCTAMTETLHVSFSLPFMVPTSQFIQQCITCSKFKYICSFIIFQHAYIEGCCHRAVRDGNEGVGDSGAMTKSVCIECKLFHDIRDYKLFLNERHNFRISLEPTISCADGRDNERTISSIETTYAKVVKGEKSKMDENLIEISCSTNNNSKSSKGPVFVISTLKDLICAPVTSTLENCLKSLEEKVKLELRLSGMNMGVWQEVLHSKVKSTTHAFSLQGTETTNFADPETRWAYMAVYTPVHASLVYDSMMSFCNDILQPLHNAVNKDNSLDVCCFGAGPGSEAAGLQHFLPRKSVFHLFDNCTYWQHNAKKLLEEELGLSYTFTEFDVTKGMSTATKEKIQKAKLFTFVRFLSAVQNLSDTVPNLRSIMRLAPFGSSFLFIDNSLMCIKNFVESLVFPERGYNETRHGKENDEYVMYTSYAEYRFEIEDQLAKQPAIRSFITLVSDWLDRPPLSDVRVYIFLVVKKTKETIN
eukprot:gene10027-11051_t